MNQERWFFTSLRCPDCGSALTRIDADAVSCSACARRFPVVDGRPSLKPSPAQTTALVVAVGQDDQEWPEWSPPPYAFYLGPVPERTNQMHIGILARRGPRQLDVLDWGCGPAAYRQIVESLGHRYVGIDLEGEGADVLADAHSLPLASSSMDHVITNAVLEHVANPFLAVREIARVLRPGGVFSGSVAFLEPSHGRSHFHVAPDGLLHVLRSAGFRVDGIWPQEGWSVFHSLSSMPSPVTSISRLVLRLLPRIERTLRARYLHPRDLRAGRWLRRRSQVTLSAELLSITAQVHFLAAKP